MLYEQFYDHVLFHADAMMAHHLGLLILNVVGHSPAAQQYIKDKYDFEDSSLETTIFGKTLKNPVGIAAGLDKNGKAFRGLSCFGPSWIEEGTITEYPYRGNKRKFIRRYHGGLINYLGLPNSGREKVMKNLLPSLIGDTLVAINISPMPSAANHNMAMNELNALTYAIINDFAESGNTDKLLYVALNFWCPNTNGIDFRSPGRRICQGIRSATNGRLRAREDGLPGVRLVAKIGPDMTKDDLNVTLDNIAQSGVDGIIATNTTSSNRGLPQTWQEKNGGKSGQLLEDRATEVIAYIHNRYPRLPIIGVGGIRSAEGALEKFQAGASVVEVYSGFVRKPDLIKETKIKLLNYKGAPVNSRAHILE